MNDSVQKQVAINLCFTLLKSIFILLSFRLADIMLSAHMMGLVLLFRRQGALWSNLAQLGFSQVLLKFYVSSDNRANRSKLWGTLLRWLVAVLCIVCVACVLFAPQINPWLFPSAPPAVTAAFGLYTAGLALGFMANSSWLSEFKFIEANLIDWLHGSLLLVVCLILGSQLELSLFSWLLAGLTVSASIISLFFFVQRAGYQYNPVVGNWNLEKRVRHYGCTRALTAYADMATLVIGPWFLRDDPSKAAQLIAAYTVLRIAQTLVLPIAQVLALRANSHLYKSDREERRILLLTAIVFLFAWIGVGVYYQIGDLFVSVWLPNSSVGVIKILDELMPFMPGICMFYALRNHVDLKFTWPCNLVTLLFSICAFSLVILRHQINIDIIIDASQVMFSIFYMYSLIFVVLVFSKDIKL